MKAWICAAASVVALAGCAMPSGDPVPIGLDTYMLGKPGSFTTFAGVEVKAALYREAGAFCARQHKVLQPLAASSRDSGFAQYASAEVTFRCLSPGDPDLRRPESAPNVVIETRAR